MRVQPCKTQGKAAGVYSLEVESPGRRTKTVERFDSMHVVLARAEKLVRAGYNVGIWSSVSLEKH
jgi:hypothetical protein